MSLPLPIAGPGCTGIGLRSLARTAGNTGHDEAGVGITQGLLAELCANSSRPPPCRFLGLASSLGRRPLLSLIDDDAVAVARQHLAGDPRVAFHTEDAAELLRRLPEAGFDLVFADAWAGKYTHLDKALQLLRTGGVYVVDDMLPQAGWPDDHRAKAECLVAELERRQDLRLTKMAWSSGVIIAVKRG